MERVRLDIQGDEFSFPINPIEFQANISFQHHLENSLNGNTLRFFSLSDSRLRVMSWRGLINKYPYTHLVSGLRSSVSISGVRINYRDLDYVGDQNIWQNIFVENLKITFNKGVGNQSGINNLVYDIDFVFSIF